MSSTATTTSSTSIFQTSNTEQKLTQAKYNAFLGTITLCIIYAVIALIMILIGTFTQAGNKILFNDLRTFTQTYIFGTVFIIIILAVYVNDWNGKTTTTSVVNKDIIDPMACPDYWKLEKLSPTEIRNLRSSLNNSTNLMTTTTVVNGVSQVTPSEFTKNYYEKNATDAVLHNVCKMDPLVFYTPKHEFTVSNNSVSGLLEETNNNQFNDADIRKNMYIMSADYKEGSPYIKQTTDNNGQNVYSANLKCNQVFPELLSKLDAEELANNNYAGPGNKYRCAYAKACGVPWTDAGCSTV